MTQEEENRIIETVAEFTVKKGVADLVLLFLEGIKPVSYVASQITLFSTAPFLILFGHYGELGTKLILLLEKKERVEKLASRIRKKMEEKQFQGDSGEKAEREKGGSD